MVNQEILKDAIQESAVKAMQKITVQNEKDVELVFSERNIKSFEEKMNILKQAMGISNIYYSVTNPSEEDQLYSLIEEFKRNDWRFYK